ncbi:unnamed protein product [Dracunculus medinensis]|uniref:Chromo domain-containing protein n=1 Tax=Dracunculus medinensis TaxID=318479 RepID=A0A0N4UJ78_DRAME|nr:unnamed protein product [Dracunculus medinensis]
MDENEELEDGFYALQPNEYNSRLQDDSIMACPGRKKNPVLFYLHPSGDFSFYLILIYEIDGFSFSALFMIFYGVISVGSNLLSKWKVKKNQFQVRWKGYQSDDDSWEPEYNLESANLVLDEFRKENQDRIDEAKEYLKAVKQYQQKKTDKRNRASRSTKLGKRKRKRNLIADQRKSPRKSQLFRKDLEVVKDEIDSQSIDGKSVDDEDYKPPPSKKKANGQSKRSSIKNEKALVKVEADSALSQQERMKIKECPIRNSKNAWLYDDADDGESEDSFARFLHSGKNSVQCKLKPVREKLTSRGEKRKSDENQEIVNTSVVNDDSRTSANAVLELELNNDQKIPVENTSDVSFGNSSGCSALIINTEIQDSDVAITSFDNNFSGKVSRPIDVLGIIKCRNSEIKVIYADKAEPELRRMASVKELFEINGFELVQYLLNRAVFVERGG